MSGYTGVSAIEAMWWVLAAMAVPGLWIIVAWVADRRLMMCIKAQRSGVSDDGGA